ncbi:related to acetylxylan esterase [Cephalotrichum gorgonifer]|uniref:Carboxylic ester hydrolase n=1 Tax=Cephalotrichum gorgonifer TaxID=2041049 RepID=A0AAE8SXU1_9PEZI|nr:related to acetylxylan esterase [Cephalotrichum gorgonifer]
MVSLRSLAGLVPLAYAASLQEITTDFGPNPTNVTFYLYVPDAPAAHAPLLVYPHWCHGSGLDAYNNKPWARLADELGYLVIYPSSPWTADHCWDLSSSDTLTHDAGGDSLGIASMVRWTLREYDVDPDRVFVTGVSSGGMMTNVLLGSYPELFAAGSAFAGVPAGCYAGDGYAVWNADCAEGRVTHTSAEWLASLKAMSPGYNGPRPKVQLFHGDADEIVNVVNYHEEIKLWSAALKTGSEPKKVTEDTPQAGWTKSTYGSKGLLEGFLAAGVTHNIPDQVDEVVRFFELDCVGKSCFSRKTLKALQGGCKGKRC